MSMRSTLAMTRQGFKYILHNVGIIKKGQSENYAILQVAHRLEKGLCISEPRKYWGYEKAKQLVILLKKEANKSNPDEKVIEIGKAVLTAYIASKEGAMDRKECGLLSELKKMVAKNGLCISSDRVDGGSIHLKKSEIIVNKMVAAELFMNRHSVRDFADSEVNMDRLERAVTLALRAPSACNRQASQIYVINGTDRIKAGSSNEYHAEKYLIITGNMKAFVISELNDWIVSTSIFCGYLSLALHAEGIGSCIFRKNIVGTSQYNDYVRRLCNIPDNEQIILEMAIGNYKDEFDVPVSCRREAADIIHMV